MQKRFNVSEESNPKEMRKITIGIACVIIGIMLMAYTGYDILANDKTTSDGSIQIRKEKSELIQWSPVVGLALFVGGITIFISAKRRLNNR